MDTFLCFRQQRVVVNGVKSDWAAVVSGVPQGTFLGPLLLIFVDDCVCYSEIMDIEDTLKLQKNIDRLGIWARNMMGYEISTSQMQHDADKKSITNQGFVYPRGYSS